MERIIDLALPINGFEHQILMPEFVARANEDGCAICMGQFVQGALLTKVPCNHFFHYTCIMAELTQSMHQLN